MEKLIEIADYLKLDIKSRDFDKGLELYKKHYGSNNYLKRLERTRKAEDLDWKLTFLLRQNGLNLTDFDANTSNEDKNEPDGGDSGKTVTENLSDEGIDFIASETEAYKEIYKEAGADQAVLADLANALESGETSDRLKELASSLDAAFSVKLQQHWDNIDYARANNALPSSIEKKEAVIDVSALSDVALIKKRGNASASVSKYKKEGKEELLAKWQPILDALDAEIKKRDLKA